MKLRLKHNSVRLRLTQSEVHRLLTQQFLEERIEFDASGPNTLVYVLRLEGSLPAVTAEFGPSAITITLPESQARLWAGSRNEVGIYFDKPLGNGKKLGITVEKDFQCSDGRPEEIDPDAYPNPIPHEVSVAPGQQGMEAPALERSFRG